MIDDYREIQNFINVCKKLNIETIGYMHSKFSKYRVSLRYDCFDKFIVWSWLEDDISIILTRSDLEVDKSILYKIWTSKEPEP